MIRGAKIALRALEPTDAEHCHRWINDPEVTQTLGMGYPLSLAQEQEWVTQKRDPAKEVRLMIETLDGTPIGSCGLSVGDAPSRAGCLGISIGEKAYWSQGYGTDAMLTLCNFGFNQMGLHRIWLHVFPYNPRGIRCYEKCGFQHEGRLREAHFKHGQYQDVLVMGLLEGEFRERWPGGYPGEGEA
jgi:RimJ/RimL family protein N-acetyltransferase